MTTEIVQYFLGLSVLAKAIVGLSFILLVLFLVWLDVQTDKYLSGL